MTKNKEDKITFLTKKKIKLDFDPKKDKIRFDSFEISRLKRETIR